MTLREVLGQYQTNLVKAASITGLGQQIIDVSVNALNKIEQGSSEHLTRQKISNHIQLLQNLYKSPVLGELVPTISGQQVVLTVSAFEVFMSDLVRCLGNNHRSAIGWPGGSSSGKVDLTILNSDVATIGDLVLGIVEQQNISFQDLQSTKRFLKEYLGIEFSLLPGEEEDLILGAAIRNVLVHAGGLVDSKFLTQLRNTRYATQYTHNQKLEITPDEAKKFMSVFQKAGRNIYAKVNAKIGGVESALIRKTIIKE